MSLYNKHKETISNAIKAIYKREFFANYQEHPSPKIYGENADKDGQTAFKAHLNSNFEEINSDGAEGWVGEEHSPYLNISLGIKYPKFNSNTLVSNAEAVRKSWKKASAETRAGILTESLLRFSQRFFENAYATMHTTGQGYMMAFQASGPHAADRALEAIAMGFEELKRFPEKTIWDKPMGKYNIVLEKEWHAIPKGTALVVGCSTFPTWNTVPGMYASLITGNPVIVKPHPGAILPIAILIGELQKVLKEEGFSPNICQMAADSPEAQITKELTDHEDVKIIDYTGGSDFGNYIENLKGKVTFTEKTGINSIIIDSVDNLEKVLQNIAFSISLYSGQMCTAPQNIFVPAEGVKTSDGHVSFDEVVDGLKNAIDGLVNNPKAGPFVLGAIQNQRTSDRVSNEKFGQTVLAEASIDNPMFKEARTMSPKLMIVDLTDKDKFDDEIFGPLALIVKTNSTKESIEIASEMASKKGAISCGAYSTDEKIRDEIFEEMSESFTSVSFNLTGGIYVNQNAAFSDFHVTGGNPAGNASFTNPEFVIKRFVLVGKRIPK